MEGRGSLMECVTQTKVFGRELLSTHSGHLRCAAWLGVVLSPFISHWRQPLLVYENIQAPASYRWHGAWKVYTSHDWTVILSDAMCSENLNRKHAWSCKAWKYVKAPFVDSWESVAYCAEWPFPHSILDSSLKLEGGHPLQSDGS